MLPVAANSAFFLGLGIGFAVVVVVVVLMAALLAIVARIAGQVRVAEATLEQVRADTMALPQVEQTNEHTVAIINAAQAARDALTE